MGLLSSFAGVPWKTHGPCRPGEQPSVVTGSGGGVLTLSQYTKTLLIQNRGKVSTPSTSIERVPVFGPQTTGGEE